MENQHYQDELEQPASVGEMPQSELNVNQTEELALEVSTLTNQKDTQDNPIKNLVNFFQEKARELTTGGNNMRQNLIRTISELDRLQNFLIDSCSQNAVIQGQNLNNIKKTVIESLEIISSLQNYIDNINSNNEQLLKEKNFFINEAKYLQKACNDLSYKYDQSQQRSKETPQLRQENKNLKILNFELQKAIELLKRERDESESKRAGMLSILAEAKRNRETSYVSGERPQNHLLIQEFKQLKDQDFHSVSNDILQHVSEANPLLKVDRKLKKQEIANIKAILSNHIFIKGLGLAIGNNSNNSNHKDFPIEIVDNAVKNISDALYSTLQLNQQSKAVESLRSDIESLVKRTISLTENSEIIAIIGLETEADFNQASKHISEGIYNDLKLISISDTLKSEIDNLVMKGLKLVKKIANADPPGALVLFNKGEVFNSEKHEAMHGSDDEGKVNITIFPAYIVGTRVFEKAVVMTVPEEEHIASNNSHNQANTIQEQNSGYEEIKKNLNIDNQREELQATLTQNNQIDGAEINTANQANTQIASAYLDSTEQNFNQVGTESSTVNHDDNQSAEQQNNAQLSLMPQTQEDLTLEDTTNQQQNNMENANVSRLDQQQVSYSDERLQ